MAPRNIIAPLLLLALPHLITANPAAPAITEGPQAYASFASLDSFSTLKPCAQGCLRYNGPYACYMAGSHDLGEELKCGCSPLNYCLCDTREASHATSYIQSCVQTYCSLPQEVSAVLDLYNGYCATANTALATTSTKPYSFTGVTSNTATGSQQTGSNNAVLETGRSSGTAAGSQQTSQSSGNNSSDNSTGGLSIGAIIGIAVGGVVLIAALLCAGCCLLWRRRRNKKKAAKASGVNNQSFTAGAVGQNTHYIPPQGGAVQIDGAGVYGKPNGGAAVVEEKIHGTSTTVTPLQTPITPNSQVVGHGQPNGQYEQVPVPVAYEKYGNSVPNQHYGHPGGQVYEKPADNVYEKP